MNSTEAPTTVFELRKDAGERADQQVIGQSSTDGGKGGGLRRPRRPRGCGLNSVHKREGEWQD